MSTDAQKEHAAASHAENAIHLPAPTQWPLIMAVGLTLLFAGLVTNVMISALGVVMAIIGAVGWFRQVLPHEAHEMLPVTVEEIAIEREGRRVTRVEHMHPVSRTRDYWYFYLSDFIGHQGRLRRWHGNDRAGGDLWRSALP